MFATPQSGETTLQNAQPLVLNYIKGTLALAHNGNLINTDELREELAQTGAIFQTTTDSELIAYEIARARVHIYNVEEAILTASRARRRWFSYCKSQKTDRGKRDPLGSKPLRLGNETIPDRYPLPRAAHSVRLELNLSETALPGEIVTISPEGITSNMQLCQKKQAHCIFEYIYFARLDSQYWMEYQSTNPDFVRAKHLLNRIRQMLIWLPVFQIPECTAAQGYSNASGIPFGLAFYKNSYIGRTFIKPTQKERESGVRLKLSVLKDAVKRKTDCSGR